MDTKQQDNKADSHGQPGWFATFTVLDASGAISSSQWHSLIAHLKSLWGLVRRAFWRQATA